MPESYTIDVEGVGPLLIERSLKAKHMNIGLRPFKGIRIAVPLGVPLKEAEQLARDRSAWIKKHLTKMKAHEKRLNNQPPDVPLDEAKRILNELVEKHAEEHGFQYNRVSVKSMKSRWGSCSAKKNINLNVKILRLPQKLRDYVILHELVHTEHLNHSALFWTRLSDACGVDDAKDLNRKLKRFGVGGI